MQILGVDASGCRHLSQCAKFTPVLFARPRTTRCPRTARKTWILVMFDVPLLHDAKNDSMCHLVLSMHCVIPVFVHGSDFHHIGVPVRCKCECRRDKPCRVVQMHSFFVTRAKLVLPAPNREHSIAVQGLHVIAAKAESSMDSQGKHVAHVAVSHGLCLLFSHRDVLIHPALARKSNDGKKRIFLLASSEGTRKS